MKTLTIWLLWFGMFGGVSASPLWNGTKAGMSVEQVRAKFPKAQVPQQPETLNDEISEGLRIPAVKYLGEDFIVRFYFREGALHQVTLALKNQGEHHKMVELARRATKELTSRIGEPSSQGETSSTIAARFDATWKTPSQSVSIVVMSLGPTDGRYEAMYFNINYQQPRKRQNKTSHGKPGSR